MPPKQTAPGGGMLWRMRAQKIPYVVATILLFALVLALVGGCGGSGEEQAGGGNDPGAAERPRGDAPVTTPENPGAPEPPEEEGGGRPNVAVRLSGTPGTTFAGDYGNLDGSEYAEGVIEDKPVEYEVDVRDSGFDAASASFTNYGTDGETLTVEILVDGEVVASRDPSLQYGAVNVTWSFGG